MGESSEPYRDPEWMAEQVAIHGSPSAVGRAWGFPERRIRYWHLKHQSAAPAAPSASDPDALGARSSITETQATLQSTASATETVSPEELLAQHGLDPSEWSYTSSITSWEAVVGDGVVRTLHRVNVKATKRPEALLGLSLEPGWVPPPAKRVKPNTLTPSLIAVFSDPHFPMHDEHLHEASIAWLEDMQPDEVVILGDISDASPFARHRKNPRTHVSVSEHQTATYQGLARWRAAAPDARFRLITGNHDSWWIQRLRELMPDFEELREHPESDEPLLSMRRVFALDDLRIEHCEPTGEYHDDTLLIAPDLVALHGVKAGRDAAVKEQAGWEGASVAQGHAHKWQITGVTKRLPGGGETQRFALNVPSMSRRDLGYSHAHDVAQGWMTVSLWPDGQWVPEMATFNPQTGAVLWRDGRW